MAARYAHSYYQISDALISNGLTSIFSVFLRIIPCGPLWTGFVSCTRGAERLLIPIMSPHAIHLRSESPDLLIEFDLPPGTHAKIGASPKAEITLPLTGIPPFSCTLGRFHDGRLYLADLDGTIARRVDLPDSLSIPPYQFRLFQPADPEVVAAQPAESAHGGVRAAIATRIRALFRTGERSASGQK